MAFSIAEDQITITETVLGRKLPPVYRAILMSNNGGTAFTEGDQWEIHPLKDTSDKKRLSRSCNDVIRETKSAQNWQGFPSDALAIGDNGCGDVMFLMPSATEPNRFDDTIFVFWHETREIAQLANDLAVFEIE